MGNQLIAKSVAKFALPVKIKKIIAKFVKKQD
jgi:hypothetical protein